jgi:hypothetical protein
MTLEGWVIRRLYNPSLRLWHCFGTSEKHINTSNPGIKLSGATPCLFRSNNQLRTTPAYTCNTGVYGPEHQHRETIQNTWLILMGCGVISKDEWAALIHNGAKIRD